MQDAPHAFVWGGCGKQHSRQFYAAAAKKKQPPDMSDMHVGKNLESALNSEGKLDSDDEDVVEDEDDVACRRACQWQHKIPLASGSGSTSRKRKLDTVDWNIFMLPEMPGIGSAVITEKELHWAAEGLVKACESV